MGSRKNIASSAPWEDVFGYSRAVRVDRRIFVSGTTATDESGKLVGLDDAYAQTARILTNIESALAAAGASLSDVVRTRIFVTDVDNWREIARAHQEAFGEIRPAATLVQVERLIDPQMLVEIEADAVVA